MTKPDSAPQGERGQNQERSPQKEISNFLRSIDSGESLDPSRCSDFIGRVREWNLMGYLADLDMRDRIGGVLLTIAKMGGDVGPRAQQLYMDILVKNNDDGETGEEGALPEGSVKDIQESQSLHKGLFADLHPEGSMADQRYAIEVIEGVLSEEGFYGDADAQSAKAVLMRIWMGSDDKDCKERAKGLLMDIMERYPGAGDEEGGE